MALVELFGAPAGRASTRLNVMRSTARALALLLLLTAPAAGCARRVRVTHVSAVASAWTTPPFYAELQAYGSWEPRGGVTVFVPYDPGYAPYRDGYWVWDERYGMTWVAVGDPIGEVACHHGRWVYEARWVWIPDDVWGPAWVDWREDDGAVGWAPLGPDGYADAGWIDCPPGAIFDPPATRPRAYAPRGRRVAAPTATWLHDRGVVVRPARDGVRTARAPVGRELTPPAPSARDPRGHVRDAAAARRDELDERRRADAEARRAEDASRRAAAEAQARRLAEEQARRAEAERRDAEARAHRDAEVQRRLAEADARRRLREDAAARRAVEEQRRAAEEASRRAAEEQRRAAAEDQRRAAEARRRVGREGGRGAV